MTSQFLCCCVLTAASACPRLFDLMQPRLLAAHELQHATMVHNTSSKSSSDNYTNYPSLFMFISTSLWSPHLGEVSEDWVQVLGTLEQCPVNLLVLSPLSGRWGDEWLSALTSLTIPGTWPPLTCPDQAHLLQLTGALRSPKMWTWPPVFRGFKVIFGDGAWGLGFQANKLVRSPEPVTRINSSLIDINICCIQVKRC